MWVRLLAVSFLKCGRLLVVLFDMRVPLRVVSFGNVGTFAGGLFFKCGYDCWWCLFEMWVRLLVVSC